MENLGMKLGENIGSILLEIAQTKISEGDPESGFNIYRNSLFGITDDQILSILKGDLTLKTGDDKITMVLVDEVSEVFDWQGIVESKLDWIKDSIKARSDILNSFNRVSVEDIENYKFDPRLGLYNIAAKLIAGEKFSDLLSSGENIWNDLEFRVDDGNATNYESALLYTVRYVDLMKNLGKYYLDFCKSYRFLLDNGFISRPRYIESVLEVIISFLLDFCETNKGYYHPMCNSKLRDYKVKLLQDLMKTEYVKLFITNGEILEKI